MFFFVIIKHISNLHNPIKPGLEDLFIPLSKFIAGIFVNLPKFLWKTDLFKSGTSIFFWLNHFGAFPQDDSTFYGSRNRG